MLWKAPLFTLAIAVAGSLGSPVTGLAQFASAELTGEMSADGSIGGQGVVQIKRQPQRLRMKIELTAKGKTLKEALANLKIERETALAKLAKLNADKATLNAGPSRIAAVDSNRQRQMEMMVRQRMQHGGKKPKKAPEPPIAVQSLITAEWKLSGADPEALLVESRTLEDNIRGANLAAQDKKGELSPEDEEAAEEAAAMDEQVTMWNENGQPKTGEPMFLYVTKISPEDRAKALAEAFAKARADAVALGKAAGAELGPLRSLTGSSTMAMGGSRNWGGSYNPYMQQMMQQMGGDDDGETPTAPSEAVGPAPQEVSLTVSVTAAFALRTPESAGAKSEAKPKK